ncbi:Ubiquitin-like modifier-activating enzyme 1 [Babesia sp. Xinjiang]|uniref:Ubiquitin-like modifier-activating enzyme 1 n=1 Tax=Babesia sp. Xinjiang TaxID=462227 RepID=UPI000A2262EB|nr:Ubiquitin-like modifier-activating enzyme 1 [Babesia sp. Xinjiang]ORM40944.1 Ubiquitin-like modifier-activating enzyme 1 [Babesia sp. Xinjiang]
MDLDGHPAEVDTDLYSRQIGTFGIEMMGKLQKLKVLIIGMKGAGAEIAKNLALMGVEAICLADDDTVERRNLGVNFFIRSADVGVKCVSEACLPQLQELNGNVNITIHRGPITEALVTRHDVAICCDQTFEMINNVSRVCRKNQLNKRVGFIAADTFGMVAAVFVDFGHGFVCVDPSGKDITTAIVSGISNEEKGVVYIHAEGSMPFQTGDVVTFSEVQGMEELNSMDPIEITVKDKESFTICDTRKFKPYTTGGIVKEIRRPKTIDFISFEEAVENPSTTNCMMTMDYSLIGRAESILLISMAYRTCGQDSNSVLVTANNLNSKARSCAVDQIDEKVLCSFVKHAHLKISPLCSFVGGVVAHEVIKFTGKYHPINQWLYCDFTLPTEITSGNNSDVGFDSRYSDHIAVWGREVQSKIQSAKIFTVGAGALGCELMKHFALLGCGTQNGGLITLTDNDHIEVSNISRQFLFRKKHVGMSKSKVAAMAAKEVNEHMKIDALEICVGPESEDYFTDEFWDELTVVVNALDNVKARMYIDGRCVWYEKPLLESGTLGTMGNVQVIIPHMTQCYSESQDPQETSIPLCTLKHFPYQVDHTIQWARDLFEGLFTQLAHDLKKLQEASHDADDISDDKIKLISQLLKINPNNAKTELLRISSELINRYFINDIKQLLYSFPKDHKTSDGQRFWSPPKRMPKPLIFDPSSRYVSMFLVATCNILAEVIGLKLRFDNKDVECLPPLRFEEFKPTILRLSKDNVNVEIEKPAGADKQRFQLIDDISKSKVQFNSIDFEKDDDANFHIEFIWATANMRCENYDIEQCDRMKAKLISGRIIPAIATTTSMIVGLVMLEFVKTICYKKLKMDHFRNSFCCLATPVWLQSEPLPPTPTTDKEYDPVVGGRVRALPPNFTVWDKVRLNIPNGTVNNILQAIRDTFNVEAIIISAGNTCIYNSYMPAHNRERRTQRITELLEKLTKKPLMPSCSYLVIEASCTDDDDTDVVIPTIKFGFNMLLSHEFLPENTTEYLVDANPEFRKRARNAISQAVRKFISDTQDSEDVDERCGEAVQRFVNIMRTQYMDNAIPDYRIGGLIGIASAAIALDDHLDDHADALIRLVLPYFTDQDPSVRYYACESLYNIAKKAHDGVVRCFSDIFDGICKLSCDEDEDVRQSSQFMNRLMREIILNDKYKAVDLVVELIASRMDVRGAAELCLAEFLALFKKTFATKTEIISDEFFNVILINMTRNEYVIKRMNIVWVRELACLQPHVIYFNGFHLLLKSVIVSIADQNGGGSRLSGFHIRPDVSTCAQEANKQLFLMTKERKTITNVENITKELVTILNCHVNHVVMLTALQWLILLLELKPKVMKDTVPVVTKAVVSCFKQCDSELIMEATIKAIILVLELGTEHFDLVSQQLLELFKTDDALLEDRGNRIIINVCKNIGFENFYSITASCLAKENDHNFLQRIVHTLNWTLLTSEDAREMRAFLLTENGDNLGTQLQMCWDHNLAAALALALWREKYEFANNIVQRIADSNFGIEFWLWIDSIVQLLDSHVFMKMRLHLLQPTRYRELLQALLGMLCPFDAYHKQDSL